MAEMASDDGDGDFLQDLSGKRRIKRWTSGEHELLVRLVEQLGEDACWATIAEHIPGRSGKQCRERWVNHIGADIKKGGWNTEEEAQVARLHATIGPAWTRIANALGGRTENSVKNHFNALLRSKRLEDKKTSILAQYVRLVRDKEATGMAAYEQAVHLMQNAVATSSQNTNSQMSNKARSKTGPQASSASDGKATMSSGSGGLPAGFGAPPGMTPIRTSYAPMGSLANPSYSSGGGAAMPSSGTPMSAPGDASAAIAAAAAAVQAANTAMAMGLSGGGMASDGLTESMQYSGGSPGVVGSMHTPSLSMSDSDQLALRGLRRTGRGGRGRPGYGHMPTLRDARSSGTPSTRDAAQAALAADSLHMHWDTNHDHTPRAGAGQGNHQMQPQMTPVSGSGVPFTPMSGSSHAARVGGETPQGGWMAAPRSPASMMHAAQHGSMGHMVNSTPSSAREYSGPAASSPHRGMPMSASLQNQVAQLNEIIGQSNEPDMNGHIAPANMRRGGHEGMVHTLGGNVLPSGVTWGINSYIPPPVDEQNSAAHLMAMAGGHAPKAPLRHRHPGAPSDGGTGPPAPHDMVLAGTAGTSANSMTLGMQDLLGPSVYGNVFSNQQGLDVGSPMSPHSRHMAGRLSGALGLPLFSHFPTQASFDMLSAPHEHDQPLLGRLSGLSLEAIMASPVSARTPSASALYFLQGAQQMRSSRPEGVTLQSQPQVLLSPFHNQDNKQDRSANGAAAADGPAPAQHGAMTDNLGLVMKPLHVKTRKGPGAEHGMLSGSANRAPGACVNSLGAALGFGTPSMHQVPLQDGTPTARMLGEVFMTWTQEPNTPSHILLGNSPHHPVMQVTSGPLLSSHQIHMHPHDSLFGPNTSFVRLQPELAGNDGPSLPEISVPAPEDMGCLEIMFDDPGPALPTPTVFYPLPGGPLPRMPSLHDPSLMEHPSLKQEPRSPSLGQQRTSNGERGVVGFSSPGKPGLIAPQDSILTLSPAQKRSSVQVWGDSYSPNHSIAKRKALAGALGSVREPFDASSLQHSTESSGTPLLLHANSADQGLVARSSLAWAAMHQRRSEALGAGFVPESSMFEVHLSYDNGGSAGKSPLSNGGSAGKTPLSNGGSAGKTPLSNGGGDGDGRVPETVAGTETVPAAERVSDAAVPGSQEAVAMTPGPAAVAVAVAVDAGAA